MPLTLGMLAANDKSLKGIIGNLGLSANLQLCLDAGDIASVPATSTTKWLDTSGGGYDFFRGSTNAVQASDPTFVGTPGALSANEYWLFDGGDSFQYDTIPNEAWMDAMHKNNAALTVMAWVRLGSSAGQSIFSTRDASTEVGISLGVDTNEQIRVHVTSASGDVLALIASNNPAPLAAWHFFALSINEATAFGSMITDALTFAFNSTYTAPSTGPATYPMKLGTEGVSQALTANSRMAMFSAWNRSLSNAELSSLYTATKGRFGL